MFFLVINFIAAFDIFMTPYPYLGQRLRHEGKLFGPLGEGEQGAWRGSLA